MDLVLKNAMVVDPQSKRHELLDIGVEQGKISRLEQSIPDGKQVVDLKGKTVLPGLIDMHVHVTQLLGGHVGYYMAAKTGVTTIIDYAGPIEDITENLMAFGCGLNVGCVDSLLPNQVGDNPSRRQVSDFADRSLEAGSLGLKILGGHFPLTPEASRYCIEEANKRKVIVAFHSGTTVQRSDILGMRESVELAKGQRMLLAHINAYCRGKHSPYLEELQNAFNMLRDNPNILSDSHMAVNNGTSGICQEGVPHDAITANCLAALGLPVTEKGLGDGIQNGLVRVVAPMERENVLLERQEAYRYWREQGTNTYVSFMANIPSVAVACVTERKQLGGDFLIGMAATDGGGFPRNGLIDRLLALHRMGYLSLEDIAIKASLNPARTFGLAQKGHLGIGADADLTILDDRLWSAYASYAGGKPVLLNGQVVGNGGCLVTTALGVPQARLHQLPYTVAAPGEGTMYQSV